MNTEFNSEILAAKTTGQEDIRGQKNHDIGAAADKLRYGETDTDRTEIMYIADVNKSQIKKNLNHLAEQGLINQVNIDGTMIACQVTCSGLEFLDSLTHMPETVD
jgi:predicted transcriptional regulator